MAEPVRMGVVGGGWRAEFFVRLARLLPEEFTVVGAVVRRTEAAEEIHRRWGVPVHLSPRDLVRHGAPEFVVSSVAWSASPGVICALTEAGLRVLSETPPAPDLSALRTLWDSAGSGGLVQVAEQYPFLPGHAARAELLRRGVIGVPTSVQISSTHTYHAIALMRGLLGVGFEPVRVQARRFTAPLVDPLTRNGWTHDQMPKPAGTTLATLDFGETSGLYDFTDNQWHNRLRHRRIVIRGSHGEISDDDVVRQTGPDTIVRSSIGRSQLGYDLDLDGFDTEHLTFDGAVVYENPFLGHRLMDEEIAIAGVMRRTAAWARDEGPGPYPLAQASQDHLIGLAIDTAVTTGQVVTTSPEPWGQ